MIATQWIKHSEAVMSDHPNHIVPFVRMCIDCKTKRVGGTYTKCYYCRKSIPNTLVVKIEPMIESNTNKDIDNKEILPIIHWQRCSAVYELKEKWNEFQKQSFSGSVYLHWGLCEFPLKDCFRVLLQFDTHSCSVTSPGKSGDIGFFTHMQIFFSVEDVMEFIQKCELDYNKILMTCCDNLAK